MNIFNGKSIAQGFMTHVTCRLTAKNRDQLRNPALGSRVWATFVLIFFVSMFLCHLLVNKGGRYYRFRALFLVSTYNCRRRSLSETRSVSVPPVW